VIARRALLAWAFVALMPAARAQGANVRRRIGFLHSSSLGAGAASLSVLRPLWAQLGFVEGETVLLRAPEGHPSRLPGLVDELMRAEVQVIITLGRPATLAAAARMAPVVAIDMETDPIRAGLARSVARPGGTVTGLFLDQPSLAAKWIDLLREAVPHADQVVLLWDPRTGRDQIEVAQAHAARRGLQHVTVDWLAAGGPDAALAPFAGTSSGIIVLNVLGFSARAAEFGGAALRYRLPMLAFARFHRAAPAPGLLMSYGVEQRNYYARSMVFVDRILAGTPPGELPIELPTRYELTLDLRTARVLGVTFPVTLLAQADEVLE